ncbi:hypothetical protein ACXO6D_03425 [Lactobacillus delbrueckii subsp. bulgaricus]|nr:hypothetical protein [Lactobacillus delbrueckii subsp. bulgaricus]MBT8860329.1 hypothetical protein [Lactobacillus delbrueckii subsp. bulgaricus]
MTENKKSIKILHSTLTSNMGGIEAFLCNLTKDIYELNKKTDVKIEFDFLMDGENPKIERNVCGNSYSTRWLKWIFCALIQ